MNQKDDFEEAIWYYEEALLLLPQTHYHFLEAICSCVYQRFQLLGHLDDLKKLLEHLHSEHNLNLEALLSPVEAQLQPRPQQLTHKFSDSELLNQMTMIKELDVSKTSSNLDAETKQAKETKFWKHNSPESAGDSEPEVRRPKNARTTKDLDPLDFQVPTQNMSLDMEDEVIRDEAVLLALACLNAIQRPLDQAYNPKTADEALNGPDA